MAAFKSPSTERSSLWPLVTLVMLFFQEAGTPKGTLLRLNVAIWLGALHSRHGMMLYIFVNGWNKKKGIIGLAPGTLERLHVALILSTVYSCGNSFLLSALQCTCPCYKNVNTNITFAVQYHLSRSLALESCWFLQERFKTSRRLPRYCWLAQHNPEQGTMGVVFQPDLNDQKLPIHALPTWHQGALVKKPLPLFLGVSMSPCMQEELNPEF